MHEVSLMTAVLQHVDQVLADKPTCQVKGLTLRVGLLSGADPEALAFCFPFVAKGTAAEGAALHLLRPPLQLSCARCGAQTETTTIDLRCGTCGATEVTVKDGQDLIIQSLEVC